MQINLKTSVLEKLGWSIELEKSTQSTVVGTHISIKNF